jgi:elongation factor G
MGSAYKNKGVQLCLDAVSDYLPNPASKENLGFRTLEDKSESEVVLLPDSKLPFVGYAFKLEENRFGQLTYVRVY